MFNFLKAFFAEPSNYYSREYGTPNEPPTQEEIDEAKRTGASKETVRELEAALKEGRPAEVTTVTEWHPNR